jgi:hypothetical protein
MSMPTDEPELRVLDKIAARAARVLGPSSATVPAAEYERLCKDFMQFVGLTHHMLCVRLHDDPEGLEAILETLDESFTE